MTASIVCLEPWMEAVGPLQELQDNGGYLVAMIGSAKVLLPLELGEKLKGCIGERISILRTDDDYRLRVGGIVSGCNSFQADPRIA